MHVHTQVSTAQAIDNLVGVKSLDMQDAVQRVLLKQALVEAREAIIFEKALPQVSEAII